MAETLYQKRTKVRRMSDIERLAQQYSKNIASMTGEYEKSYADYQKMVAEIQPLMPRVMDNFQIFLRELRPSDLEGSAGLYRLKEELVRRINAAIYPARVEAILFKDVLVQ